MGGSGGGGGGGGGDAGFALHFEIGGTFGLIPYFCTLNAEQHIGDLIIFGGTSQILGVKNPLQRVNRNAGEGGGCG